MTGEMVLSASALLGGCLTGFVPAAGWPESCLPPVPAPSPRRSCGRFRNARFRRAEITARPFSPRAGRAGAGFCRIPAMRSALCRSAATSAAVRSKRLAPRVLAVPGRFSGFRSKSGSFPKMSLRSWAGWAELLGGKRKEILLEYRSDRSGSRRYFEMRVRRAADRDGGCTGIIRDVTDIKAGRAEVENTNFMFRNILDQSARLCFREGCR